MELLFWAMKEAEGLGSERNEGVKDQRKGMRAERRMREKREKGKYIEAGGRREVRSREDGWEGEACKDLMR